MNDARGIDLEIVEAIPSEDSHNDIQRIGVLRPNTIRINGQAVIAPGQYPVIRDPHPLLVCCSPCSARTLSERTNSAVAEP